MNEPDTSLYKAWVCPYCGNESDENSICCDEWHREYQTIDEDPEYYPGDWMTNDI